MAKKQTYFCKGCIHYIDCQMQPTKDCYTSKKGISMEEKIAQRKELQAWRKKVAKMYNM